MGPERRRPETAHDVAGQKGMVLSLAFSPDGRTLFSFAEDRIVRLWNVADGKLTERDQIKTEGTLRTLAVAPDGKTLALGTVNGVEFWDLSDGKPRWRAPAEGGDTVSVAYSPDGQRLVSAGRDLIVWDAATGRKLREWKLPGPVRWAAFAPDGRHLITVNGNGTVYVLRLDEAPAKAEK